MIGSKLPVDGFSVPWRLMLPSLYPEGVIPLLDVAEAFFGLSVEQAKLKATARELPLPTFKLGSQKSPWVISVDDFIALIDTRNADARDTWHRINKAAA